MDEHKDQNESDTPGGLPQEPVEDRPNVGIVEPEDYPEEDRERSISDPPLDEDKEYERLNPGSGGRTPGNPDGARDRDLA
jgi:hypothetical protein